MDGMYRTLTKEEEIEFRKWARENFKMGDEINSAWHPVIKDECNLINTGE